MHAFSICERVISSAQFSKGIPIDFLQKKREKIPTSPGEITHLFFQGIINLVLNLSL